MFSTELRARALPAVFRLGAEALSGSAPVRLSAAQPSRPLGHGMATAASRKSTGSSSGGSSSSKGKSNEESLQIVPGIGGKNEVKLQAANICTVSDLKRRYNALQSSGGHFSEVLVKEVGIRRAHADSIVKWLASQEGGQRVTFSVEGNIGAGKSTFLKLLSGITGHVASSSGLPDLSEQLEIQDLVEVVPEPVDEWTNLEGSKGTFNILDEYYKDPDRWAYTFQNYVFITRYMQERRSASSQKSLRVLERSVFSDRMVFVRQVHETTKNMNDLELSVYDSWFNPFIRENPTLVPDGFIYLRADPSTCMERMRVRDRREEVGVRLDYLEGLHEKHEQWFMSEGGLLLDKREMARAAMVGPDGGLQSTRSTLHQHPDRAKAGQSVLRLSSLGDMFGDLERELPSMPERLDGKVVFLEKGGKGKGVTGGSHDVLHGVPALVLDYGREMDVLRDPLAQQHVRETVREYFIWVREWNRRLRARANVGQLPSAGTLDFSDGLRQRITMERALRERDVNAAVQNYAGLLRKVGKEILSQAAVADSIAIGQRSR